MWFKVLTVINTLLLVVLVAAEFDYIELQPEEEAEVVEEVVEEPENSEEDAEEEEEDLIGDTLKIDEDSPYVARGFVDLTGYLVTETEVIFGSVVESAYFAFTEASDETASEFIKFLADNGNTVNRYSGSTYYFGLGCAESNHITNTQFDIRGSDYTKLSNSSSGNPIVMRAFLGESGNIADDACISWLTGFQLVE